MNKTHQLQAKVGALPEHLASEVLDFLEFITMRHSVEQARQTNAANRYRGAFKGRLSLSDSYAKSKSDEIQLEE
jgi:hypothetical protein